MSVYRRKQPSKRRWKARFGIGVFVPHIVAVQHSLLQWLQQRSAQFSPNVDGWKK